MTDFFSNGTLTGAFWGTLLTLLALFAFGVRYNAWVERLGIDAEGFVWLLVVGGVAVTIFGITILSVFLPWNAGELALIAFISSGSPMIYGGVRRYIEARRRLLNISDKDDDPA